MVPHSLLLVEKESRNRVEECDKETTEEESGTDGVAGAEHLRRENANHTNDEQDQTSNCEGNHRAHFKTPCKLFLLT